MMTSRPPPLPRSRVLPPAAPPSSPPDSWSTITDTARLVLPPAFLVALRAAVPRRRRARVPYIIGAGILAVVVALGADASTREFIALRRAGLVNRASKTFAAAREAPPSSPVPAAVSPSAEPSPTEAKPVDHVAGIAATALPTASGLQTTTPPRKARVHRPPNKKTAEP